MAALSGPEFETLETDVRGHWDRKWQFGIGRAEQSFTGITVETRIATKEEQHKVGRCRAQDTQRCPVHAILKKAIELRDGLFVNGQEYRLLT